MNTERQKVGLTAGDALIVVDVQNDFLPGGRLAVPCGHTMIPALSGYLAEFTENHLPIIATRDWHPANHCSFQTQGGRWPVHCVTDSKGAAFASELECICGRCHIGARTVAVRSGQSWATARKSSLL